MQKGPHKPTLFNFLICYVFVIWITASLVFWKFNHIDTDINFPCSILMGGIMIFALPTLLPTLSFYNSIWYTFIYSLCCCKRNLRQLANKQYDRIKREREEVGERKKGKPRKMREVDERGKGKGERGDHGPEKMWWGNTMEPRVRHVPKWHAGKRWKGIDYLLFLGTPDNVHTVKASSCHLLLPSSEHLLYIYITCLIISPFCSSINWR